MRFGQWALVASGEGFRTDGYTAVPKDVRGTVDTPVASQYGSGTLRVERMFGNRGRVFLSGSLYGEDRLNGTPLQINDTTIRQLAFGTDYDSPAAGLFTAASVRRNGKLSSDVLLDCRRPQQRIADQHSVRSFAANGIAGAMVEADREPPDFAGGTRRSAMCRASATRLPYSRGKPTAHLSNGGTQQSLGAFAEGIVQITSRWSVTFSGTGRPVEQLRRQLDAHSDPGQTDTHCLP